MAIILTNPVLVWNSVGFYLFSVIFLAMRLLNNTWLLKQTRWEDVAMVFAFLFYTISVILINATNHFTMYVFDYRLGSILYISAEQTMLYMVFIIKISVMGVLYRLSHRMQLIRTILVLIAIYTAGGLILLEILFYGVLCKPFYRYWAITAANNECSNHLAFSTLEMAFDVSSIMLIMAIAGSIAYQSKLPFKRMSIVIGLLCMSAFTVVSAALKGIYKQNNPGSNAYWLWCVMGLSTTMWIANWIHYWPAFQILFNCYPFSYPRFSHIVRNPNEGQESPRSDPTRVTTPWWNHLVTALMPQRVGNATEQEVETNDLTRNNVPRARHAASASMGTTIMIHTELADYLENGPGTPHSQPLKRDDDTSPALVYREIHQID